MTNTIKGMVDTKRQSQYWYVKHVHRIDKSLCNMKQNAINNKKQSVPNSNETIFTNTEITLTIIIEHNNQSSDI